METEIITLSVETATRNSSLALLRGENVIEEWRGDAAFVQSEGLLIEIKRLLESAEIDFDEINLFAAVIGPGSFSGLRVGLATVKGLAIARKIRSIGVTTLETCAAANEKNGLNFVVLSAGRGNVFTQSFEINVENKFIEPKDDPQHVSLENVAERITLASDKNKALHVIIAPEIQTDLTELLNEAIEIHSPNPNLATSAGKIAVRRYNENATSSNDIQPLYLRPVDIGKPKTS